MKHTLGGVAAILALVCCATQRARADTASCAIADQIPTPAPVSAADPHPLPVAGYQLVFSWSPEHCAEPGRSGPVPSWDHRFQCVQNHFGFVVHGLWPQSATGTGKNDNPRNCKPSDSLASDLIRQHLCTVPGAGLMQNEWQAHGTCNWSMPDQYFDQIEQLVRRFQRPVLEAARDRGVKGGEIRQAFMDANPAALRADQIGVRTVTLKDQGRKGKKKNRTWLQEAYLCLDLSYQPVSCPVAGAPDATALWLRAAR